MLNIVHVYRLQEHDITYLHKMKVTKTKARKIILFYWIFVFGLALKRRFEVCFVMLLIYE